MRKFALLGVILRKVIIENVIVEEKEINKENPQNAWKLSCLYTMIRLTLKSLGRRGTVGYLMSETKTYNLVTPSD